MTITFTPIDGEPMSATVPYHGAQAVDVPDAKCPACGDAPLRIAGVAGTTVETHNTIEGVAGCLRCKARIGRIVVTIPTIFGIAEDRAVLNGRPRVY